MQCHAAFIVGSRQHISIKNDQTVSVSYNFLLYLKTNVILLYKLDEKLLYF